MSTRSSINKNNSTTRKRSRPQVNASSPARSTPNSETDDDTTTPSSTTKRHSPARPSTATTQIPSIPLLTNASSSSSSSNSTDLEQWIDPIEQEYVPRSQKDDPIDLTDEHSDDDTDDTDASDIAAILNDEEKTIGGEGDYSEGDDIPGLEDDPFDETQDANRPDFRLPIGDLPIPVPARHKWIETRGVVFPDYYECLAEPYNIYVRSYLEDCTNFNRDYYLGLFVTAVEPWLGSFASLPLTTWYDIILAYVNDYSEPSHCPLHKLLYGYQDVYPQHLFHNQVVTEQVFGITVVKPVELLPSDLWEIVLSYLSLKDNADLLTYFVNHVWHQVVHFIGFTILDEESYSISDSNWPGPSLYRDFRDRETTRLVTWLSLYDSIPPNAPRDENHPATMTYMAVSWSDYLPAVVMCNSQDSSVLQVVYRKLSTHPCASGLPRLVQSRTSDAVTPSIVLHRDSAGKLPAVRLRINDKFRDHGIRQRFFTLSVHYVSGVLHRPVEFGPAYSMSYEMFDGGSQEHKRTTYTSSEHCKVVAFIENGIYQSPKDTKKDLAMPSFTQDWSNYDRETGRLHKRVDIWHKEGLVHRDGLPAFVAIVEHSTNDTLSTKSHITSTNRYSTYWHKGELREDYQPEFKGNASHGKRPPLRYSQLSSQRVTASTSLIHTGSLTPSSAAASKTTTTSSSSGSRMPPPSVKTEQMDPMTRLSKDANHVTQTLLSQFSSSTLTEFTPVHLANINTKRTKTRTRF